MADTWISGDTYESFMGRWSQLIAHEVLQWLAIPPGMQWIDVGCGTGVVTRTILTEQNPSHIVGVDSSEGYLTFARQHLRDSRVQFALGDAAQLPLADQECDIAISGLLLNFAPQPEQAVKEMRRVVHSSGIVAAYVWDYAGQMEFLRYFWNAVVALHPADQEQDEGRRFPLCQPEALRELWQRAGLNGVVTAVIDVPTVFQDFNAYWIPFLSGQGPAPSYCMRLSEEARGELREYLRTLLPTMPDGSIHLLARAWAIRGVI